MARTPIPPRLQRPPVVSPEDQSRLAGLCALAEAAARPVVQYALAREAGSEEYTRVLRQAKGVLRTLLNDDVDPELLDKAEAEFALARCSGGQGQGVTEDEVARHSRDLANAMVRGWMNAVLRQKREAERGGHDCLYLAPDLLPMDSQIRNGKHWRDFLDVFLPFAVEGPEIRHILLRFAAQIQAAADGPYHLPYGMTLGVRDVGAQRRGTDDLRQESLFGVPTHRAGSRGSALPRDTEGWDERTT